MGPLPVVVAWGCQSPFGVEAAEGVARIALGVRQVQVAVPADDDTDHPTLQRGNRACAASSLQAQHPQVQGIPRMWHP